MNGNEQITAALVRRIEAAVADANVSRAAIEYDWPECHRSKCQQQHGSPDSAFTTLKIQVMKSVRNELDFHSVTRPDVADDGDSPEDVAVYTLATLLNRYNVHDAGTFVKAARLIVDAYPALIRVLGDSA